MSAEKKRILLIVNLHKSDARSLMGGIARELSDMGHEVVSFAFEGKPAALPEGSFDLAFSLGGDGTVLYAARCMGPLGIPILPVNLGTLGFIASVHRQGWREVFAAWLNGTVSVSSRLMLDVCVQRGEAIIASHVCLNDAVISASGISKIIRLDVGSDTVRFGRYRSDGLIVSTPTGSTAYSVAAGGPILDPEMEALILNPVCPFTLSNRPIVIPSEEAVHVFVEYEQRSDVMLTIDGQIVVPLLPGDTVSLRGASYKLRLLSSDRNVFYRALRSKLNWSGGPDA